MSTSNNGKMTMRERLAIVLVRLVMIRFMDCCVGT